ncbi:VWFA domain-containing protein [Mycena sanguinolenta]|uniref:VWFA domain-containing protein n=1 Tax=Mycena sanguinolenta TaxID=230812 RepID=A0A8H7DFJ5_9AGAR|nr:VWFA domain-containing protein [Mycena sanguinolenta]
MRTRLYGTTMREDIPMDIEEGSDRLFTFEVAKTNEQEEAVSVGPGFTMHAPVLSIDPPHAECTLDASELEPALIRGEIAQAILTKHYVPSHSQARVLRGQTFNSVKLKNLVTIGCIRFGPSLTDEGIQILMGHGLNFRFPRSFEAWQARNKAAQESLDAQAKKEEQDTKQKLTDASQESEPLFREAIIDRLITLYPTINRTVLSSSSQEHLDLLRVQYNDLITLHPKLKDEMEKAISGGNGWTGARFSSKFKNLKEQLFCLDICLKGMPDLEACDREHLIKHIGEVGVDGLSAALKSKDSPEQNKGWLATLKGWGLDGQSTNEQRIRREIRTRLATTTDSQFLAGLDDMLSRESLLQDLITRTVDEANAQLKDLVQSLPGRLADRSILVQYETFKAQIQRKFAGKLEEHRKLSRHQFDEEYQRESPAEARALIFEGIERSKQFPGSFKIDFTNKSRTEPAVECRLHILHLTADNQQEIQLDSKSMPSPHLQASAVQVFRLPLGHQILHAQLIDGGKLLLIIEDLKMLYIYLESPATLERAVSRGRDGARRALHRDKIGKDVSLSYDEQKRMLSLCAVSKLQLYIFVFDETFSSLQAWGSILDLRPWYTEGTFVTQSCFVCGTEEILFIDTSGQARIFSLITQQFRPASLSLPQIPHTLYSSPDGACFVASFLDSKQVSYRAYHWATFGSSAGIDFGALDLPTSTVLTSFVNRRNVHLVGIDMDAHVCRSVVLDITKKTTEFMFKETGLKSSSKSKTAITSHNSLIDCFSDVWTRFPVVAAVQRRTILSSVDRKARKLIFVTDRDHDKFKPHFSELISVFEQKTRKPIGDALKSTQVLAIPNASFFSQARPDEQWDLSTFHAGEFLLELLCLIPLQLAVTRENRFFPLKDGQTSAAFERSLLGAEVGQIVDSISIGWYESVFQSYMTSKPVKVVSSMGEQSVGKSYALNHLADTSFAGSAMRTTEGVWMSVTPTDEYLLVSLDFEGVHSIERSAQEDTLLVLFNTAISNLVLFRNNFAISRILDPAANPTLFRSTLTIIIKDVVESDKNEIVKEFSTKFQKIVEEEQDANFISRLHAGQLNIIPWPVIESKQFYLLFPAMKRLLDKQEITHRTAGEFLHTLKTLMAKLKANDWGSISQTLIAHRAQKLLGGLRNALMYGFFEVEPDSEPLKVEMIFLVPYHVLTFRQNFDTDELIEQPDTEKQFFLSSPDSSPAQRESMLATLQKSWDHFGKRPYTTEAEWVQELSAYLTGIAELRIEQVHSWISSNLSRFQTNNANIEMLKRIFETTIVDLRTNVEICGAHGAEIQHIKDSITPDPTRAKDWISHSLFWRRTGFKGGRTDDDFQQISVSFPDPYSRPDQVNFSKCDAMCPDAEHAATATNPADPSYCTLPLFHPPAKVAAGLGYLSNDGHVFNCRNPSVMQQAFHVSSSMKSTDRGPLQNAPGTPLILRSSNNRLGAVYSALHGFWMSRNTALSNTGQATAASIRRDAYSVVLFDHTVSVCIANDFTNTPDQLLNQLVAFKASRGTDFTLALISAQKIMEDHWSNERTPVVIFLSDGECRIADETVRDLCRKAVALGKPLSFHAVSFGSASKTSVLRRMAQVALEVQTNAPHDPLIPAESIINSSYSEALDTVRLAETFLAFAESLKKPRGALISTWVEHFGRIGPIG